MKQIFTPQINTVKSLPEKEDFEPGTVNKLHDLLEMDFDDEAKKENTLKRLKSQSLDEIADFILVTLDKHSRKDELPQWLVDAVMDRYFQEFEKNPVLESNEYLHDEYLMELVVEKLISYHGNDRINQPINLTDKAFLSAVKYRIVHEEATHQYLEMLLGGGDLVRADILINGMADLGRNQKNNGGLVFKFAEHYSYHKKETDKGFEKLLDFKNPENYSQAVKIIDFLKKLHKDSEHLDEARPYFGDWSSTKTAETGVKDIIKKKLSETDGSFLLRLHAEHYLGEMNQWEQASESKKRLKMFEDANDSTINLAPGVVGYYDRKDNILYINRNEGENLEPIELSDLILGNAGSKISDQDRQFLDDFIFMSRPDVREIIFKKIGISLSKIPLKEQANFLQLLISKKESEIGDLKDFISEHKEVGLRTFLSMEHGGREMGDKIIEISKSLNGQPEVVGKLFARYAKMVDGSELATDEVCKIHEEIFFEKNVNRDSVYQTILKRGLSLLMSAHDDLMIASEDQKVTIIDKLIKDFDAQELTQNKAIVEVKQLATGLAQLYSDVDIESRTEETRKYDAFFKRLKQNVIDYYLELGVEVPKDADKEELDEIFQEFHRNNPDIEEPEDYLDLFEISKWPSWEESLNSHEEGSEEWRGIKNHIEKYKKWDSQRILERIEHYEKLSEPFDYQKWLDNTPEYKKNSESFEVYKQGFIKMHQERNESNKVKYKVHIDKYKKLLEYQINLENKLDQIIFGHQSAELPKNFNKSIEIGIENYNPELSSEMEPIYMPVGVSRLLPKEGDVSLKPIDALTWLMWMQNQGAKSELTVCDTIQTTNYQALYNLSPEEARAKAQENGNRDKQFYQAAIDTLGLSNIRLGNYQELEHYSGTKDWFAKIQQLATESPVFAKAFGSMIEGSVATDAGAEQNINKLELLKQYGQQEIAFIIANPALKISHEKEPRYDVLARVIPVYLEIKKHVDDLGIKDDQELLDLSLYLSYYKQDSLAHLRAELFNTKESASRQRQIAKNAKGADEQQVGKETAQQLTLRASALTGQIADAAKKQENKKIVDLLYKNIRQLGLSTTKVDDVIVKYQKLATEIEQKDWYKKIKLSDFYYPQTITSLSFEMSTDQQKEAMGFREQYSTYRGDKTEELALESNQVIASTSPLAAAKLLILSQEKQAVYAEKVLKPLLINYYLATNKTREDALVKFRTDSQGANTISDLIHLIQDKIVKPIEIELASQKK